MVDKSQKLGNRYVNDLRKLEFSKQQEISTRFGRFPFLVSLVFLMAAGYWGFLNLNVATENIIILVAASTDP